MLRWLCGPLLSAGVAAKAVEVVRAASAAGAVLAATAAKAAMGASGTVAARAAAAAMVLNLPSEPFGKELLLPLLYSSQLCL